MKLYHTSPERITHIRKDGMFDDCLFFSARRYQLAAGCVYTYTIDIDKNAIIEARQFFYDPDCARLAGLVAEIQKLCDVDEETAQDLLTGRKSVYWLPENADPAVEHDFSIVEIDFTLQAMAGRAAKLMGYEAAQAIDEQGAVYIVPMFGRESDLTLVENDD